MKILILSDEFPPSVLGGAGVVAFNLAKGLEATGHDVYVLTTTEHKEEEDQIEIDGLKIYRIFSSYHSRWRAYVSLNNLRIMRSVERLIKEINPQVLHAHNIHTHLSYRSLKIAKEHGAKVILTAHDSMLYGQGKVIDGRKISWIEELRHYRFRYNPIRNLAIKYYLKYVDRVVAVSDTLRHALVNNGINNVVTIHNGIDLDTWVASDELVTDFKVRHGLKDKKVVFFSGRLGGAKGGINLVAAMAMVIRECPEAVLLIAGREDRDAEAIKDLAKKENILDRLIFTGWLNRKEMVVAYRSCDVVAYPSVYLDPFGMNNIEAMATQKPIVASSYGGAREIVVDGETGYIVDVNNINLFAEKISGLLKDKIKSEIMGKKGYERVQKYFSLKQQVRKYLDIYEEVIV